MALMVIEVVTLSIEQVGLEQDAHVGHRVDGHPDLSHLALGPRVVGVVAHLGGQVEGARQSGPRRHRAGTCTVRWWPRPCRSRSIGGSSRGRAGTCSGGCPGCTGRRRARRAARGCPTRPGPSVDTRLISIPESVRRSWLACLSGVTPLSLRRSGPGSHLSLVVGRLGPMDPTFSHFGICVSDLDRSLRFYRDALGFRRRPRAMKSAPSSLS